MFEGWTFLIAEIWMLLALALIVGFVAGWLIFGGRGAGQKIAAAEADLNTCRAELAGLKVELDRVQTPAAPLAPPVSKTATKAKTASKKSAAKSSAPKKPRALKTARKSGADDLKVIKGIGPELEKLCNKLGFFHYDQIAKWTKDEIAWVDENLEGFKGRVTRDKWVAQAKKLVK